MQELQKDLRGPICLLLVGKAVVKIICSRMMVAKVGHDVGEPSCLHTIVYKKREFNFLQVSLFGKQKKYSCFVYLAS
jgi:hypothetical protein